MSNLSWKTKRKGYWLFKSGKVKKNLETNRRIHFKIQTGVDGRSVIFDKIKEFFTCDCNYYSLKFKDCSHIHAVKLFLDEDDEK